MSMNWTYDVELRHEAEEVHAYSSALPDAIASGATEAEALLEMSHAIVAAVQGRMKFGMGLEPQSLSLHAERHSVALPARLAAKASIYAAWKSSGSSKVALGALIGRTETEVRRILDPEHGTKLDQLDEAAVALGGRLAVSFVTP